MEVAARGGAGQEAVREAVPQVAMEAAQEAARDIARDTVREAAEEGGTGAAAAVADHRALRGLVPPLRVPMVGTRTPRGDTPSVGSKTASGLAMFVRNLLGLS